MKTKLLWKLFGAIVLVVFLSLTLLYFHLTKTLTHHLSLSIERGLQENALLIRDQLDALPITDWEIQKMDPLADQTAIEIKARVTIMNERGKVIGDSGLGGEDLEKVENHLERPEVQTSLHQEFGMSRRHSMTIGTDMMYVAIKARHGFVRVALPLHVVAQTTKTIKKSIAFSSLMALVLASLVGFFLSHPFSRSLKEMSDIADHIVQGDFSKRLLSMRKDELGTLAKAINTMAVSLERQFSTIETEKNQLKTILDGMVEGVLVTNAQGEILLANPALQSILGLGDSSLGRTLLECVRNKMIHESIQRVLQGGKPEEQEVLLGAGSRERYLILHAVPLTMNGKNKGSVSVFYDVTNLRKLERVRQEFVANASHELKTPLTNILGYAETLRRGALQEANAARFIEKIENHAIQLKNLVDHILKLSEIESGHLELHPTPLHLETLLAELQGDFEEALFKKRLLFEKRMPPGFLVHADPSILKQILKNLLDNAIQYTSEEGKITVAAETVGHFHRVTVFDTGIGIPEKDLPHIFERFYCVDKARSREGGGTGLGLSIVKHLVQAQGGEVGVESQLGNGSSFFFTLPIK